MKIIVSCILVVFISSCSIASQPIQRWLMVDNFESAELVSWEKHDTQNNTKPYIQNPQITKIIQSDTSSYLIKKPAMDGVVGNRKAISFKKLPVAVEVGETYTFFTKILVESFPNNHAFGLSNLRPKDILMKGYNAFEPTIRVTDKFESNGFKNDGTLMVKIDSTDKYRQYSNIQNYKKATSAKPLIENQWYELWYVVNNSKVIDNGQVYDLYIKGGEFKTQTLVYRNANFRMKRELPLIYFMANTNTGSKKKPYGNGGLAYDDIYMSKGVNLEYPNKR